MKHTVQSLVRAALLLGLCLAMLVGCTVVRQTVTATTSTSSTSSYLMGLKHKFNQGFLRWYNSLLVRDCTSWAEVFP